MNSTIHYLFIIVGVGGTGGNFAKEFCRLVSNYPGKGNVDIVFYDGDKVERKNTSRQPYSIDDLTENKAVILAEKCSSAFNLDINAVNRYITDKSNLISLINFYQRDSQKTTIPIIIGTVDNHKARRIMHEVFTSLENCIYLDSGNEDSWGDVVCGIKIQNKIVAPDKTFYFKEILTDDSLGKEEESCGVINQKNVQHLVTNLQAANILLGFITDLLIFNNLVGGIVYFDVIKKSTRFEAYKDGEFSDGRD